MKQLVEILDKNKYKKIKFKITKTQHLLIKAKINGVAGNFILDTELQTAVLVLKV
jgi:hypothetical protein